MEKIEALADYADDPRFTDRERIAIEFAERMTHTDMDITDAFFARAEAEFTVDELVELAAVIALENFRSKFNPVFAVESGESCDLPWVQQAAQQAAARLH